MKKIGIITARYGSSRFPGKCIAMLGDKPLLIYAGTFGKVNGVDYVVELAR